MKRIIVPILLIILPLLVSCPIADPFAELEGINLLSTAEQAFTGWAVEYGTPVTYDYLTFSSSAEAGPTTGDTAGRIELVNLVPNGDFEAAVGAAWTADTIATINVASSRLEYSFSNLHRINFDLSDATEGLLDGIVSDAGYIIHFDIKSTFTGASYFEHKDPTQTWNISIENSANTYSFPADFRSTVDSTFSATTATQVFTIGTTGSGGAMTGYIDNLRITRTDIDPYISITIPVTSEGRADLLSGMYRFTVYVKNDPDVTPVTTNRMPAEHLTLCIESPDTASVSNISLTSYDEDWADWTACSVTGQIQVDDGADSALVLKISPTDTFSASYRKTLGSLIISAPVLEFSSSGVFE